MTKSPHIPDEQTRQNSVRSLRSVKRDLDSLGLEMDELMLMLDAELNRQQKKRFKKV